MHVNPKFPSPETIENRRSSSWHSISRPIAFRLATIAAAGALMLVASSAFADHYLQTNLVSDVPGLAATTHMPLVNPWGLARSATSPWWVADNGAGVSTLYNGGGTPLGLVVTVPVVMGGTPPSTPTGTVFNGTSDFQVGPSQPARFLFVTEDGTISGWNPAANPTNAILKVDWSGTAVFKGATLGQISGKNVLYVADFRGGKVAVFDASYNPVTLAAGAFWDRHLPKGYAPFNVQNINGMIFVSFAEQDSAKHDEVAGRGRGFVDAFDATGVLLRRLQHGPWMNAPWGLALAPASFGRASNRLLVGNFGSGKIASFDASNGHFRGMLRGDNHLPILIDGLWALSFGNDASAGPSTTLYFTAGIDDEAHGLFGTLTSVADTGDGDHDLDDM
jgi:uncharacterized protein (TIGR03118 family)